jgi:hypothetical protein
MPTTNPRSSSTCPCTVPSMSLRLVWYCGRGGWRGGARARCQAVARWRDKQRACVHDTQRATGATGEAGQLGHGQGVGRRTCSCSRR